jgi:hypothetical protein
LSCKGSKKAAKDAFFFDIAMVYIHFLETLENGNYYTGYTDNVAGRLIGHNETPHNTISIRHRLWRIKRFFLSLVNKTGNNLVEVVSFISSNLATLVLPSVQYRQIQSSERLQFLVFHHCFGDSGSV